MVLAVLTNLVQHKGALNLEEENRGTPQRALSPIEIFAKLSKAHGNC